MQVSIRTVNLSIASGLSGQQDRKYQMALEFLPWTSKLSLFMFSKQKLNNKAGLNADIQIAIHCDQGYLGFKDEFKIVNFQNFHLMIILIDIDKGFDEYGINISQHFSHFLIPIEFFFELFCLKSEFFFLYSSLKAHIIVIQPSKYLSWSKIYSKYQFCICQHFYSQLEHKISSESVNNSDDIFGDNNKIMTKVFQTLQGQKLQIFDEGLGGGSFGEVKKGILYKKDKKIDVAVKILTGYQEYAIRQYKNLCNFKDNHGIVPIYGIVSQKKDQTILILQLYETDLKQYVESLKRAGKMNKKVLFSAIVQVMQALSIIHEKNIYHRDLKQSNILVRRYGPQPEQILVSLTDFGLSKSINDRQQDKDSQNSKTLSEIAGKFQYLAPEAINAEESSTYEYEKVDAWALGIMTYKILSGSSFIQQNQQNNTKTIKSKKESYEYAIEKIRQKKLQAFTRKYLQAKSDEWSLNNSEEKFILYLLGLTLCLEPENRFSVRDFKNRGQASLKNLFKKIMKQYFDQKNLKEAGVNPNFKIEKPEIIMGFQSSTITHEQFKSYLKDVMYSEKSHQQ